MEEMILKLIQRCLQDVPLVVLGSGASIPYGIPGMTALADELMNQLSRKFNGEQTWDRFSKELTDGKDLETALQSVHLPKEINDAIIRSTWEFINTADSRAFQEYLVSKKRLPLADLFNKLLTAHPKKLTVVTTNYDRISEYAADQSQALIQCGFQGRYFGFYRGASNSAFRAEERVVLILKVHGSLDWFSSNHGTIMLPGIASIPTGFFPLIVTPGFVKYQRTHQDPYRSMISLSDQVIRDASSYLCIGYGFNDEHIHPALVNEVTQMGKPLVLVTRTATPSANRVLESAAKFISIESNEGSGSVIRSHEGNELTDNDLWTLDEFVQTIW